jgi:hypothetical protein
MPNLEAFQNCRKAERKFHMELSNALSPLANPLLREVENVSPAMSLDLVVGFTTEEDGSQWPVYRTYFVGALMVDSHSRQLWRVLGFTRDNHVIAAPHGFHVGALRVAFATFSHEGLDYPPCEEVLQHRDSLLVWS